MTFSLDVRIMSQNFLEHKNKKGSPLFIIPPESTSSHDSNCLLFIESALAFHFSVSGFAHDFTFFCFGLAYHTEEPRVYNSGARRGCIACSFQFAAPHYQVCSFYNFRFSYVTSLEFYNSIHISQIVESTY